MSGTITVAFERDHLRALTDWISRQAVPQGLPVDVAEALQAGCDAVDGVRRTSAASVRRDDVAALLPLISPYEGSYEQVEAFVRLREAVQR